MRPGSGEKIGEPEQELSETTPYIHQELPPAVSCSTGDPSPKMYAGEAPEASKFQDQPEQPTTSQHPVCIPKVHVKSRCHSGSLRARDRRSTAVQTEGVDSCNGSLMWADIHMGTHDNSCRNGTRGKLRDRVQRGPASLCRVRG